MADHCLYGVDKNPVAAEMAEVLRENEPMLRVFEKMKFPTDTTTVGDAYRLKISLK